MAITVIIAIKLWQLNCFSSGSVRIDFKLKFQLLKFSLNFKGSH